MTGAEIQIVEEMMKQIVSSSASEDYLGRQAYYDDLSKEVQEEVLELYELLHEDKATFGYRLLEMAREVRASYPELMAFKGGTMYEARYIFNLIPEVAVRCGVPREELEPCEAQEPVLTALSDQGFREAVGVYFSWLVKEAFNKFGRKHFQTGERSERELATGLAVSAAILVNKMEFGNPVAFAVDQIHPASPSGQDQDDFIARKIRRWSELKGHEETAEWHPGLLEDLRPASNPPSP